MFEDCMNDDLNTPKLMGEICTIYSIKQKWKPEQLSIKKSNNKIFI